MISVLDSSHAEAAIALWERCGLTRPWNPPLTDFTRAVEQQQSDVLGLCEGEKLVGTVMVGDDGHRGWVYYLAVDPEQQGSGLGRQLMDAAEDWARRRGLPKLQLMVRSTNEQALGFYAALGMDDQPVTVLGRWLHETPR